MTSSCKIQSSAQAREKQSEKELLTSRDDLQYVNRGKGEIQLAASITRLRPIMFVFVISG